MNRNNKKINNHPVAEFVAKFMVYGIEAYVVFIAFIVMGAILHII